MRDTGIKALTEGQKQCLRLVYQHQQSKEIARALGISVATVNQRIDGARAKLGNVSRISAARMLAAAEGTGLPDPILYDPIGMAEVQHVSESSEPIGAGPVGTGLTPWSTATRPVNELPWTQRVIGICAVAILGLLAVAVLVSIMNGIGALLGR